MRLCWCISVLCAANVLAGTYYLDNSASGPVFDGSQADPWQSVEQAQTYLNALPDGGSGDTVLVAPGDCAYGDWVDGAFQNDPFSALQKQQVARTDWLVIMAADPQDPPEFRHLHLYGVRNAYLEFNGLHVVSRVPHPFSECVHIRNGTRHVRFMNLEVDAEDDSTTLPDGFMFAYNDPGNILVEGCEIHHLGTAMPISGDTVTVRNNHIHHIAESGVKSGGNGFFLVEGNHIHDQVQRIVRINLYGGITGTFVRYEPITQDVTGARATVYYISDDHLEVTPENKVVYEFEPGYAVRADTGDAVLDAVDTVYTADASHGSGLSVRNNENYVARGNIIHDYGSTAGIYCYPVGAPYKNVLFENNLVYDAITRTMVINDCAENVVVRNNTLIGGFQVYTYTGYNGSGLIFHNNIAGNFTAYYDSILTSVVEGNNIINDINVRSPWGYRNEFSPASTSMILTPASGSGATSPVFTESLFVDYTGKDFRLRAGSPAIDFGDPAHATATDFNGFDRDGTPDAGCYEYGSPAAVENRHPEGSRRMEAGALPNPISRAFLSRIDDPVKIYTMKGNSLERNMISREGMYIIKHQNRTGIYLIVR